eukprot:TRINITY_DN84186_c0_g1_i1.p1 TRINITY_DN84186_c0_g1~~TRINITY_DN84186_c0_g1_i1.p1  ORF type:complete len:408 (+),score=25.44 TRINITY_DN84186_c0_g1_i1:35-1258(+)
MDTNTKSETSETNGSNNSESKQNDTPTEVDATQAPAAQKEETADPHKEESNGAGEPEKTEKESVPVESKASTPTEENGTTQPEATATEPESSEPKDEPKEEPKVRAQRIVDQLLAHKDTRPSKQVKLAEADITFLLNSCHEIFMSQPMLLELKAPLSVVGDIHGQYPDLLRILTHAGFPPHTNYLFLGDYVDRGRQSIECICLLLAYKLLYPEKIFLLRGNHESSNVNRMYGFFDECKKRYNISMWKAFGTLFNTMPVAAVVEDKILGMHGGISPELSSLEQIRSLTRPCEVGDDGLLCDILWSDPEIAFLGWGKNTRGISHAFGPDILKQFLHDLDLDLVVRAHQVVQDGYQFFADRGLVTVFSAPNYCGEFDNSAGIMLVKEDLMCSFKVLRAAPTPKLVMASKP